MGLLARQGTAVRKRSTQRRPPECHLVVRPAASRADSTSGTEQRNPETEGERGHDSRWTRYLPRPCRLRLGVGKASQTCRVESSGGVVVPVQAVALGEAPVHGVPQCDLQSLQRTVERCAGRRVPRVEVEGLRPIAPRSLEVRAQAFRGERRLQFVQEARVPASQEKELPSPPRCGTFMEYTPGSPLPSGMRPGSSPSR